MCVIQVFLSQTRDNSRVLIQFIGILKVTVQMPVLTTKTNRSSFFNACVILEMYVLYRDIDNHPNNLLSAHFKNV